MPVQATEPHDVLPSAPNLRITVDQEVIDKSCRADSSHCMIADAVRKCYPWARNVTVDVQTIRVSDPDNGVRYVYLTPRQAQLALLDFDAGIKAEPLRFTLPKTSAHVSWMKRRPAGRATTEAQREAVRGNLRRAQQFNPKAPRVTKNGDHVTVTRAGGATPPLGALAHGTTGRKRDGDIPTARRRTYGLRAMAVNQENAS